MLRLGCHTCVDGLPFLVPVCKLLVPQISLRKISENSQLITWNSLAKISVTKINHFFTCLMTLAIQCCKVSPEIEIGDPRSHTPPHSLLSYIHLDPGISNSQDEPDASSERESRPRRSASRLDSEPPKPRTDSSAASSFGKRECRPWWARAAVRLSNSRSSPAPSRIQSHYPGSLLFQ